MCNKKNNEFGLSETLLDSVVKVISGNKLVDKILVFGSRAKGNYKKGSDIDLAIFGENLDFKALLKIKADVSELNVPNSIDIVHFDQIKNRELQEHILRVGITIFEKSV